MASKRSAPPFSASIHEMNDSEEPYAQGEDDNDDYSIGLVTLELEDIQSLPFRPSEMIFAKEIVAGSLPLFSRLRSSLWPF